MYTRRSIGDIPGEMGCGIALLAVATDIIRLH
jgi:hypothetical protein